MTALGMSIAMITAGCSASQAVPPATTAAATAAPETAAAETGVSAISETEAADVVTTLSKIDNTKWQYNAEDDVYYQIGISYSAAPADESYETLSVFVPGAAAEMREHLQELRILKQRFVTFDTMQETLQEIWIGFSLSVCPAEERSLHYSV
jgi:hypothetical protein